MNELDIALCNDAKQLRRELPGTCLWDDFGVLCHVAYVRPRLYIDFMDQGLTRMVEVRDWDLKYLAAAPTFMLLCVGLTIAALLYVGARCLREAI